MYLEKAKRLLQKEYEQRKRENISNFKSELIEEKIRHSYQVLGAGNYLLEHESCFCECKGEDKEYLQAAVLLHDIGRFYEAIAYLQGKKIDHGVYGAQMLAKIPEFNHFDIILAIRHHGHIIEELYEDKDYQQLVQKDKERVQKLIFLIRDADKLANFYLLASHFDDIENVFFVKSSFEHPFTKKISPNIWADFQSCRCFKKKDIQNFADHALSFLSWIYDLNYQSSFVFMKRHDLVSRMCKRFSKFWDEKAAIKYRSHIENYITSKCEKF